MSGVRPGITINQYINAYMDERERRRHGSSNMEETYERAPTAALNSHSSHIEFEFFEAVEGSDEGILWPVL